MASSSRMLLLASAFRRSFIPVFKVTTMQWVMQNIALGEYVKKCSFYSRSLKLSDEAPKINKRLCKLNILYDETDHSHIKWWKNKMQNFKKSSSLQLAKRLAYTNLLGLDATLKNGSLKEGTLNMEMLQFKSRFPREVLLCRVGEFYEAIGFDACVLVEHAGLNPCGGLLSGSVPKAGCPAVNLRQTLDDLTRNGFSTCVVEEVQAPIQSRTRKERFIAGHAHPGSPYVFGLSGVDHDVDFPEPMPVVGISRSAKGYCMISVLEPLKTFYMEDGLTEEAIVTKLRTCQCHHLFLHSSLRNNSSGTFRWGEFGEGGLLWGECNGKSFEWFDGILVEELLFKVKEIYGLDEFVSFRNATFYSDKRPKPLYLGTATQIGVIQNEGIPSLLKVLLPSNNFGLPALYLKNLLLNPPTFEIASAIQEACRLMCSLTCSIPEFTCFSAAKLVKLLESKEANHIEFCKIKNIVDEILQMHRNTELSAILRILLEPAWLATGLKVDYDTLVEECALISQRIGELISLDGEKGQEMSSFAHIPPEFFYDMESSWKGRVKRIHAEEAFGNVDRAAESLFAAVIEDFVPIIQRIKSIVSSFGGPKGEICYAREQGAVCFKGRHFMPSVWANTMGEEQLKQLKPAVDSKRRKVGEEWYTTTKVEDALLRYQHACAKAKVDVLELLKHLSTEMQAKINILVFSSVMLVIAKALFSHVRVGLRRKWVLPNLCGGFKPENKTIAEAKSCMEITGLSPYWFDTSQGNAIQNNVKMQSIFLLTGPNGGGKSSLLRSVCAAALLGICGLMIPALSATIPHFDAIMLHMKPYDSPVDAKSSFQIEMSELRSIVTGATKRSLVLVDEICRGTETAKGTCIAGSIVEKLDEIGCLGIVSTHLHGIFALPLSTKNVLFKQMGIDIVKGHIKPTWKLLDGVCGESLAFETALREGLPESIVSRAEELYLSLELESNSELVFQKSHSDVTESVQNFGTLKTDKKTATCTILELQRDIENSLNIIFRRKLIKPYNGKNASELSELLCFKIGAREQPPPSTVGTSCVYVLFRPDKKLYVGQTDDLLGRVHTHRTKPGMHDAEFVYVKVPGKSIASLLETLLINQLPLHGFRLTNIADGKHHHFGTSDLSENVLSAPQQS